MINLHIDGQPLHEVFLEYIKRFASKQDDVILIYNTSDVKNVRLGTSVLWPWRLIGPNWELAFDRSEGRAFFYVYEYSLNETTPLRYPVMQPTYENWNRYNYSQMINANLKEVPDFLKILACLGATLEANSTPKL